MLPKNIVSSSSAVNATVEMPTTPAAAMHDNAAAAMGARIARVQIPSTGDTMMAACQQSAIPAAASAPLSGAVSSNQRKRHDPPASSDEIAVHQNKHRKTEHLARQNVVLSSAAHRLPAMSYLPCDIWSVAGGYLELDDQLQLRELDLQARKGVDISINSIRITAERLTAILADPTALLNLRHVQILGVQ